MTAADSGRMTMDPLELWALTDPNSDGTFGFMTLDEIIARRRVQERDAARIQAIRTGKPVECSPEIEAWHDRNMVQATQERTAPHRTPGPRAVSRPVPVAKPAPEGAELLTP